MVGLVEGINLSTVLLYSVYNIVYIYYIHLHLWFWSFKTILLSQYIAIYNLYLLLIFDNYRYYLVPQYSSIFFNTILSHHINRGLLRGHLLLLMGFPLQLLFLLVNHYFLHVTCPNYNLIFLNSFSI